MKLQIDRASAGHWPAVAVLLADAGLPTADLAAEDMADFLVAEVNARVVAAIALQQCGAVGLLRSLVVAADCRGQGAGEQLCQALEVRAVQSGVAELWLLTNDAGPFFVRHGYQRKARDDAPAAIRESEEFRSLCPASAELYSKVLRAPAG